MRESSGLYTSTALAPYPSALRIITVEFGLVRQLLRLERELVALKLWSMAFEGATDLPQMHKARGYGLTFGMGDIVDGHGT